jgi:fructokinase
VTIPLRIGIDLGGTKIEGVLLAEHPTEPLIRRRIKTPRSHGYDAILDAIAEMVRSLQAEGPQGESTIGIGIPGTVSASHGLVKNANTVELIGKPLQRDLEIRLGRPVFVENDANCFALAEALHGAGRGARCVFGVILGTGVGGGIVLDRKIWPGSQGIAGEWGHTLLDPAGPPCYCGRSGCVEVYLSGPGLEREYAGAGGAGLPAAEIWTRAGAGEELASRIVASYKTRFGRALAQVVNVLDPDRIVLGGGVSNAPGLAEEAPALIRPYLFNDEILTRVCRHELGDSAGVLGAAWLGAGTTF